MIGQEFNLDAKQCSPIDLVPRFGTRLRLDQKTITLATEIIMKLNGTKVMQEKTRRF